MGYRIIYGAEKEKRSSNKSFIILVFGAVIAGLLLWPAGRNKIRDLVLPGDADVTAAALQGLAEDLSEGDRITDAVTGFCQEIIAGGQ